MRRTSAAFTAVRLFQGWLVLVLLLGGCRASRERESTAVTAVASTAQPTTAPPALLYVPDGSEVITFGPAPFSPLAPHPSSNCPIDMVSVRGEFCIDRFEGALVDTKAGRRLSPFYHPTRAQTRTALELWERMRFTMGESEYQILPIPAPPSFQLNETFSVKATSARGVTPSGYLSGLLAGEACKNAGKRLCREDEWVTACRGERGSLFPYGNEYVAGKCNVKNGRHPARILHGHAGKGHLDPRLNEFPYQGQALLHATGQNPECVSRWGDDGVWDMVGNLDEWIDEPSGAFLGGFYARNTEAGCSARISVHPPSYYDYSLGVRCCL
jgi:formylglycine-generating enzyme